VITVGCGLAWNCPGVCGGIGVALSGRIADAIAKGDRRRLLLFMATTNVLSLTFSMTAIASRSTTIALIGLAAYAFVSIAHLGPSFAVVLNITPIRYRGLVIALLQVCANFLGAGFGPFVTGRLSQTYGGAHSLSHAMLTVAPVLVITITLALIAARLVGRTSDALSAAPS
jgi:MFS family permease